MVQAQALTKGHCQVVFLGKTRFIMLVGSSELNTGEWSPITPQKSKIKASLN